jgi:hypothetical protein
MQTPIQKNDIRNIQRLTDHHQDTIIPCYRKGYKLKSTYAPKLYKLYQNTKIEIFIGA